MVLGQTWGELLKFSGKAKEVTVEAGEIQRMRKSWSMPRGSSGVQVVSSEAC